MKKLLLGILAITTVFSLAACNKKAENEPTPAYQPSQEIEETVSLVEESPIIEEEPVEFTEEILEETESTENTESSEEQVGVGNTDEGMVVLVLEQHFKNNFENIVEEVIPTEIKVYTPEEIEAEPAIKEHNLQEGDIVFSANYDLKIVDGYEDMMSFTAANGEIDGQWVKNKSNIGIARRGENGYTLDAFGTGW